MAPKGGRGGGGSSGGGRGGSSVDLSCPGAFEGIYSNQTVVTFSNHVVFLVLSMGLLFGLCAVQKRHGHAKKLAGPIYGVSVLFLFIGFLLSVIGTLVTECGHISPYDYFNFAIVFSIFWNLSEYLLLVIVVYGVNILLRKRLGSGESIYIILCVIMVSFVGLLMVAYTGLLCYTYWLNTPDGMNTGGASVAEQGQKLSVAYYSIYLVVVIASGALATVTIFQLRSKRVPVVDLGLWVGVITFCMFFWLLLTCIVLGDPLDRKNDLTFDTRQAFGFIINFFVFFTYIAILFLAKSYAWDHVPITNGNPTVFQNGTYPQQMQYAPVPPQQQQYAYVGQPGQQYQQPQQLQQPQQYQQPMQPQQQMQPMQPQQQMQPMQPQQPQQQPAYAVPELVGGNGHAKP